MFSGITNDDASLPGSHSVTEERRRGLSGRDMRQREERGRADRGKARGRRAERRR